MCPRTTAFHTLARLSDYSSGRSAKKLVPQPSQPAPEARLLRALLREVRVDGLIRRPYLLPLQSTYCSKIAASRSRDPSRDPKHPSDLEIWGATNCTHKIGGLLGPRSCDTRSLTPRFRTPGLDFTKIGCGKTPSILKDLR